MLFSSQISTSLGVWVYKCHFCIYIGNIFRIKNWKKTCAGIFSTRGVISSNKSDALTHGVPFLDLIFSWPLLSTTWPLVACIELGLPARRSLTRGGCLLLNEAHPPEERQKGNISSSSSLFLTAIGRLRWVSCTRLCARLPRRNPAYISFLSQRRERERKTRVYSAPAKNGSASLLNWCSVNSSAFRSRLESRAKMAQGKQQREKRALELACQVQCVDKCMRETRLNGKLESEIFFSIAFARGVDRKSR